MLLLSEGQTGEDWKIFQNGMLFSNAGLKRPSEFAMKKVTN
jgi:hypothetical protein